MLRERMFVAVRDIRVRSFIIKFVLMFLASFSNSETASLSNFNGFKKISSYGKCSKIVISNHGTFSDKQVPFYIFSDNLDGNGILKHSIDGSGNAESLSVNGEFDGVLDLDADIDDFEGTPIYKWAVSSTPRTSFKGKEVNADFFKSFPSIAQNSGFIQHLVLGLPSFKRIYTRSSQIIATKLRKWTDDAWIYENRARQGDRLNNGSNLSPSDQWTKNVDISTLPVTVLSDWDPNNPSQSYILPVYGDDKSKRSYKTRKLGDAIDENHPGMRVDQWLESPGLVDMVNAPIMAGKPFIFGGQVVGLNCFGEKELSRLPNFFLNSVSFRLRMPLDLISQLETRAGITEWWWVTYMASNRMPYDVYTKSLVDQRLGKYYHNRGSHWCHDYNQRIQDNKVAAYISFSRYDSGGFLSIIDSIGKKPDRGVAVLADYKFSDGIKRKLFVCPLRSFEIFFSSINLAGYELKINYDFSVAKKVVVGKKDSTLYLGILLNTNQFEVLKVSNFGDQKNQSFDSVVIPVDVLDISVDNNGNFAVVDAQNLVWWANIANLIDNKASLAISDAEIENAKALEATISEVFNNLDNLFKNLKPTEIDTTKLEKLLDDYIKSFSSKANQSELAKKLSLVQAAFDSSYNDVNEYCSTLNSIMNEIANWEQFGAGTDVQKKRVNDIKNSVLKSKDFFDSFGNKLLSLSSIIEKGISSMPVWQNDLSNLDSDSLNSVLSNISSYILFVLDCRVNFFFLASGYASLASTFGVDFNKTIIPELQKKLEGEFLENPSGAYGWFGNLLKISSDSVKKSFVELVQVNQNKEYVLNPSVDANLLGIKVTAFGNLVQSYFVVESVFNRISRRMMEKMFPYFFAKSMQEAFSDDKNTQATTTTAATTTNANSSPFSEDKVMDFIENVLPEIRKGVVDCSTNVSLALSNEHKNAIVVLDGALTKLGVDNSIIDSGSTLATKIKSIGSLVDGLINSFGNYMGGAADSNDSTKKTSSDALTAIKNSKETITNVLGDLGKTIASQLTTIKDQLDAAKDTSQIKDMSTLVQKMQFVIGLKDQVIVTQQAALEAMGVEFGKQKEKISFLTEQLTTAQGDLNKKVVSIKAELQSLFDKSLSNTLPTDIVEKWKAQNISLTDLSDILKEIIKSQQSSIDELKSDKALLEEKLKQVGDNLVAKNALYEQIAEQNKQLRDKLNQTDLSYTANIADLRDKINNAEKAGLAKDDLNRKLKDELDKKDALAIDLDVVNKQLRAENERLNKELQTAADKRKELEAQQQDLKNQLEQSKADTEKQKELNAKLSELNSNVSEALQKEQSQVAKLLADNNATKESLRRQEDALQSLQSKYESQTTDLKNQIQVIAAEKARVDKLNADVIDNLDKLNTKLLEKLNTVERQLDICTDILDQQLDFTIYRGVDDLLDLVTKKINNNSISATDVSKISGLRNAMPTGIPSATLDMFAKDNLSADESASLKSLQSILQDRKKQKDALLGLMGLNTEEASLFESLINGSSLSASQLNQYRMDWMWLDYSEIISQLSILRSSLEIVISTEETKTAGFAANRKIDSSLMVQLPSSIGMAGGLNDLLTGYEVLSKMSLFKSNDQNVKVAISPREAFNLLSEEDKSRVKKIISPPNGDFNSPDGDFGSLIKSTIVSDTSFKQAVAKLFLDKITGDSKSKFLNDLSSWKIDSIISSYSEKMTDISSDFKNKFDAQVKKSFDSTGKRSIPYYLVELQDIISGNEQSLKAALTKAKLSVLIKQRNAEASLREEVFKTTLQGLQQKANEDKADLQKQIAKGEVLVQEALKKAQAIEDEKNMKIASQISVFSSYEASTRDVSMAKLQIAVRKAKNRFEQTINNYYEGRLAGLQTRIAAVREAVGNNVADLSSLQVLIDEDERLSKWFEYAPSILPLAQKTALFDKKLDNVIRHYDSSGVELPELIKYEIDLGDKDVVVTRNKKEFGVDEERNLILGLSNDLIAKHFYFTADYLQGNGASPDSNRFQAIYNSLASGKDLLVVNQSDNLVSLEIAAKEQGKDVRYRIVLVPKSRTFDLVSGFVADTDDAKRVLSQIQALQPAIIKSLGNKKDYDVALVNLDKPDADVNTILGDGSTVVLKLVGDVDTFVGIPAYRKKDLISIAEAVAMPATYSNESIHFTLRKKSKDSNDYLLIDTSDKFKLVSYNDKLILVDKDAIYIDTKENVSVTAGREMDQNNTRRTLLPIAQADGFVFEGGFKNARIKSFDGRYLKANKKNLKLSFDKNIFNDADSSSNFELYTDEQFFFLEGAAPKGEVDDSAVIIRTFSSVDGNNLHGYLTFKQVGDAKRLSLSYSPWVSGDYHSRPGLGETVFSVHRFAGNVTTSLDRKIKAYLDEIKLIKDDKTIVDQRNGYIAREKALAKLFYESESFKSEDGTELSIASVKDMVAGSAASRASFEDVIFAINDLVGYKISQGTLLGKDAEIIRGFVKDVILPNQSSTNFNVNGAAGKILLGEQVKGSAVGGLVNLSAEAMSIKGITASDIVALKFKESFVVAKLDEKGLPVVGLLSRNRMDDYANFKLVGSIDDGFNFVNLTGTLKLALDSSNKLVAVDAKSTGGKDLFVFSGDDLASLVISEKTTGGILSVAEDGSLFFDAKSEQKWRICLAKVGSFEQELFALNGGVSYTSATGAVRRFQDILTDALQNNSSKMNDSVMLAAHYINGFSHNHKKDGLWKDDDWFKQIRDTLYGAQGLTIDPKFKDVISAIDVKALDQLVDAVKIFSADSNEFFVLSVDGSVLATTDPVTISEADKKYLTPLKFLGPKDAQNRSMLVRFIPINQRDRVYGIAQYVSLRPEPSYLKVLETPVVLNNNSYSMALGNVCRVDEKNGRPTEDRTEMFEISGKARSIQIKSLSQIFSGNSGYLGKVAVDGTSYLAAKDLKGGVFSDTTGVNFTLQPLESIEKDLYLADVAQIPYCLYKNLYEVIRDSNVKADERVRKSDIIVEKFCDYVADNIDDAKTAAIKKYWIDRNLLQIVRDPAKNYYEFNYILDVCSTKLAFDPITSVGIEYSPLSKNRLSTLTSLVQKLLAQIQEDSKSDDQKKAEAKAKAEAEEKLTRPAMSKLNELMISKGRDFSFVVSDFIILGDDVGLKSFLIKIFNYLFGLDLSFEEASFKIKGGFGLLPLREDLTIKDINEVVGRIRRLYSTAFVINPDHPLKPVILDLVYKLSGLKKDDSMLQPKTEAQIIVKEYSQMRVKDRLKLASDMIKGADFYVDVDGKEYYGEVNKTKAAKILDSISEEDITAIKDSSDQQKIRNLFKKLKSSLTTVPRVVTQGGQFFGDIFGQAINAGSSDTDSFKTSEQYGVSVF